MKTATGMRFTGKNRELLFWLLQIIGWFAYSSTSFIYYNQLSYTYLIYGFLTYSFMGILITSLLRFYLKKNIDIKDFRTKEVIKILLSCLLASVVFYWSYVLIEKIYDYNWERTKEELAFIKSFYNWWIVFFNSMLTTFGWVFIYFLIKFLMKSNQNRLESMELSATLREAQLNTLKGQVNPHFMFNSLNNIRGLMLEDVSKSREMINKLSEMLQYALSKNSVDTIALEEELEMVENYIALSKIQMEDRLRYEKEIAPESLKVKIPPMIVQLLVENAAKHGISNLKDGGSILVKTEIDKKELWITVANTGKLQISKDSTQLGLKNIEQRLRLQFGDKANFKLEEANGEVVAQIKIPLL